MAGDVGEVRDRNCGAAPQKSIRDAPVARGCSGEGAAGTSCDGASQLHAKCAGVSYQGSAIFCPARRGRRPRQRTSKQLFEDVLGTVLLVDFETDFLKTQLRGECAGGRKSFLSNAAICA